MEKLNELKIKMLKEKQNRRKIKKEIAKILSTKFKEEANK
jgi:hypothetical protein